MPAVLALYRGLRSLSAGRKVGVAVDPRTNATFAPGVFRIHKPYI